MTVTSKVDLWNIAITRLGHEPISEEGENTKAGRLCRLHYPLVLDAVLRSHPWNFAVRRAALASVTTSPSFEYDFAFALPTDPYCLKVIRTDWEADGFNSDTVPYRIETINHDGTPVRSLLCNEDTCSIEYVARVTDVSLFDALFADALAARLAAEIAIALTDNKTAADLMMSVYQEKLAEARVVDSQEGTPRDWVDTSAWLRARA